MPRGEQQFWKIPLWWGLMILGSLALVVTPLLPWETTPSPGGDLATNGFNNTTILSGPDNAVTQLEALGTLIAGAPSAIDDSGGDGSGVIIIPGLSSIPPASIGGDAAARWGIFVLVPGVFALFTTLWTLWGERERRRNMARWVFVCGGVTVIPLIHQLTIDGLTVSSAAGPNTAVGIGVGLAGAVLTMVASGVFFVLLRA
jgi:hypothetical protein